MTMSTLFTKAVKQVILIVSALKRLMTVYFGVVICSPLRRLFFCQFNFRQLLFCGENKIQ